LIAPSAGAVSASAAAFSIVIPLPPLTNFPIAAQADPSAALRAGTTGEANSALILAILQIKATDIKAW
jgi:hypothetical protein